VFAVRLEDAKAGKQDKMQAISTCRDELGKQKSRAAATDAQIKLLNDSRADQEGFPEGARRILDKDAAIPYAEDDVLGPLAELIKAEPGYERVLETVVRPLLDAIVVRHDETIKYLVSKIEKQGRQNRRVYLHID